MEVHCTKYCQQGKGKPQGEIDEKILFEEKMYYTNRDLGKYT